MLQPLSVQDFLENIGAETHFHVTRHSPGYFDGLLPELSANEGIPQQLLSASSALRLVKGKEQKAFADCYRLADGTLDVAGVRTDYADGYTIVVDGVDSYSRAVASVARAIEVELNYPTQVNAYLTPPSSQGLAAHYDDHDLLVLQLQGSKVWHLYNAVNVPPHELWRHKKSVPTDGLPSPTDVRLEAGDVLCLPRGRVHAAETDAETSLHLTVGIHAPTVFLLAIGALRSLSQCDDRLHARLPPRHLDDTDLQTTLGDLMRNAVRGVEGRGVIAGALEELADVLVRRGRCPPVGQVSTASTIDGLTIVRKYQPLYSRVADVTGGVALKFAQLSITAASDHRAALLFASSSTEPFRVGDLPGLRAEQQMELARKLIVSGFLTRLPDD